MIIRKRIGNNIIPFNYIKNSDIQKDIVKSNLKRIKEEFEDRFKQKHYSLQFSDLVIEYIVTKNADRIAEFGGRSVTTSIEDEVMKELSKKVLMAEYYGSTNATFTIDVDNSQIRVNST
jgi:ATP-dependent Clp protease ATP-binding subunit ClpA